MKLRHGVSVFRFMAHAGLKRTLGEPLAIFGSFLTYAALVVAYSNVFRGLPLETLAEHHISVTELIWYFGITELVLFCGAFANFRELQNEIQSEEINLSLLRPCPVWVARLGEWAGQFFARFIVLLAPALFLVGYTAESFALNPARFLGLVASIILAGFLYVCFHFFVGASCLWIRQSEPAYWLGQKLLFVFGALVFPFIFYPNALQQLAWLTPFPSALAVPGQWIFEGMFWDQVSGLLLQVFWVIVILMATARLNRAMLRRIQQSNEDGTNA